MTLASNAPKPPLGPTTVGAPPKILPTMPAPPYPRPPVGITTIVAPKPALPNQAHPPAPPVATQNKPPIPEGPAAPKAPPPPHVAPPLPPPDAEAPRNAPPADPAPAPSKPPAPIQAPSASGSSAAKPSGHAPAEAPEPSPLIPAAPRALALAAGTELKLPSIAAPGRAGMSVQLWLKPNSATKMGRILLLANREKRAGLMLEQTPEGGLRVVYVGKEEQKQLLQVSELLSPSVFSQITVTIDAKGISCMFLNGELVAREDNAAIAMINLNENSLGKAGESIKAPKAPKTSKASKSPVPQPEAEPELSPDELLMEKARSLAEQQQNARWGGMIAELRVWGRALGENEIEQNWQSRKCTSAGLLLRMPLDGTDKNLGPAAEWKAAKGLALMHGTPKPKNTVVAKVVLLSSSQLALDKTPVEVDTQGATAQAKSILGSKSGDLLSKPRLMVDLGATNEQGQKVVGGQITVVPDRDGFALRTVNKKKILFALRQNTSFTLSPGALGTARLEIVCDELSAPVLKARHGGMNSGEWSLFAPDRLIHRTMASLTERELTQGRSASMGAKSQSVGLVKEGAGELRELLKSTLGMAAAFSYEGEEDGALSFGDESPKRKKLQSKSKGARHNAFELGDNARPGRHIGRGLRRRSYGGVAVELSDEGAVQSFGFLDWFEESIIDPFTELGEEVLEATEEIVEEAGELAEDGVEFVANVADDAVESARLGVKTVIDGVSVAGDWVIETVEDAAKAAEEVFAQIGKSLAEVVDWLAIIFDWDDILETAEVLLSELKRGLRDMKSMSKKVFEKLRKMADQLESKLLKILGGTKLDSKSNSLQSGDLSGFEDLPPALDFILELFSLHLPGINMDLGPFEPIQKVLEDAWSKLASLAEGLPEEFEKSGILESLKDPKRFVDGDPNELLGLARMIVTLAFNLLTAALDLGSSVLSALIDAVLGVLDLRIDIPILTDFIEEGVLQGQPLTIGRLFSLICAIPLCSIYKAISGSENGPFAQQSAKSFANSAADITFRAVGTALILVNTILDELGAADKKAKTITVVTIISTVIDVILSAVFGMPLMDGLVMDEEVEWDAATILGTVAWGISVVGAILSGIEMILSFKKSESAAKIVGIGGAIVGALGGLVSCSASIVELATQYDEKSEAERRILGADLSMDFCEAAASATTLIPTDEPKVKAAVMILLGVSHGLALSFSTWGLVETCVDA